MASSFMKPATAEQRGYQPRPVGWPACPLHDRLPVPGGGIVGITDDRTLGQDYCSAISDGKRIGEGSGAAPGATVPGSMQQKGAGPSGASSDDKTMNPSQSERNGKQNERLGKSPNDQQKGMARRARRKALVRAGSVQELSAGLISGLLFAAGVQLYCPWRH